MPLASLENIDPRLDARSAVLRVLIETPKNSRNKYSYAPEEGVFELGGVLPEGMAFPFDFGFVPRTLGEDGDPLDVLVLMDAPVYPGVMIEARLIGVIEARQAEKGKKPYRNDRLIAVASNSHSHIELHKISQIGPRQLAEIESFFGTYNKLHGKSFHVLNVRGPKAAVKTVKKGFAAYKLKET